jgi:hypothetical protein
MEEFLIGKKIVFTVCSFSPLPPRQQRIQQWTPLASKVDDTNPHLHCVDTGRIPASSLVAVNLAGHDTPANRPLQCSYCPDHAPCTPLQESSLFTRTDAVSAGPRPPCSLVHQRSQRGAVAPVFWIASCLRRGTMKLSDGRPGDQCSQEACLCCCSCLANATQNGLDLSLRCILIISGCL